MLLLLTGIKLQKSQLLVLAGVVLQPIVKVPAYSYQHVNYITFQIYMTHIIAWFIVGSYKGIGLVRYVTK